ncbi:Phosphatase [Pandoraea terrae]|uniref:Phosphatase n=1 Tax=Pandoraea terrae TaxID=1537710 RepID=A0A5E4TJ77_9BURK|nr:HAD family phosphatase [Pandoraea terrae]VVD87957.1 Phosphatase [Pandoraea terrae]
MYPTISLVLFDLDGVLCRYDRTARIEHIAAVVGQSAEAVIRAVWDSGLEGRADAGEVNDAEYLGEMGKRLGCPITLADWLAARRASMTPDTDVLRVARDVAARKHVAVFTNNCHLIAEHIAYLCPEVAEVFGNTVHTTAEVGVTKPSPQAFRGCLAQIGAAAAETLFIDDGEANVAGAIQAGLHAHRFVGANDLRFALASHGVL